MGMKTKVVKINGDIYELTAVPCNISGAVSIELLSKNKYSFIKHLPQGEPYFQ